MGTSCTATTDTAPRLSGTARLASCASLGICSAIIGGTVRKQNALLRDTGTNHWGCTCPIAIRPDNGCRIGF